MIRDEPERILTMAVPLYKQQTIYNNMKEGI